MEVALRSIRHCCINMAVASAGPTDPSAVRRRLPRGSDPSPSSTPFAGARATATAVSDTAAGAASPAISR